MVRRNDRLTMAIMTQLPVDYQRAPVVEGRGLSKEQLALPKTARKALRAAEGDLVGFFVEDGTEEAPSRPPRPMTRSKTQRWQLFWPHLRRALPRPVPSRSN